MHKNQVFIENELIKKLQIVNVFQSAKINFENFSSFDSETKQSN